MKRILTASIIVAVSLAASRAVMAQDIIHTYDSVPIKVKAFAPVPPYMAPGPYGTYPLDYRRGHYYGPYGRIPREHIADFIGYSLYGSEYMKASSRYTWGIYLTGAGLAGLVVTVAAHIAYADMNDFTSEHGMSGAGSGAGAGVAVGYIGSVACIGAGIPLWVKGSNGLRRIADDYNRTYVNPAGNGGTPNLSLGATRSGIGLAFNF